MPDKTPNNATRKAFEDKLAGLGIVQRQIVPRTNSAAYDIKQQPAEGFVYLAHRTATQPAIVRVCFGTIRVTRIISDRAQSVAFHLARFEYSLNLYPWAQTLYSYLHLRKRGMAESRIMQTDDPARPMVVLPPHPFPETIVLRPPDGTLWYVRGYPPPIRRAFPRKYAV